MLGRWTYLRKKVCHQRCCSRHDALTLQWLFSSFSVSFLPLFTGRGSSLISQKSQKQCPKCLDTFPLPFFFFSSLGLFLLLFHLQGNKLGYPATTAPINFKYLFLFLPLNCNFSLQKWLTDNLKSLPKPLYNGKKSVWNVVRNKIFISCVRIETMKTFFFL